MCECKDGQCSCKSHGSSEAETRSSASSGMCMCADRSDNFMCLAKQAHYELLKEKMKAVFEARIGAKMDKVAALTVDTALLSLQHKMEEDHQQEAYDAKLMDIYRS